VYIELFVVAGKHADLEGALKKAVEEIRGQVQRPDRVRLATIKIRPDAVDSVLKYVEEPPERVPPHYRSLVGMLRRYGITRLPAVIVDGVKLGEGDVGAEEVVRAVRERAKAEFPELSALEIAPPRPEAGAVRPVVEETRPAGAPPAPPPPPPSPPLALPPALPAPRVKIVLGRPDNCNDCAYYGPLTSRCFLHGFAVTDAASPPCRQYARGGG
jgi:hypothetical protein